MEEQTDNTKTKSEKCVYCGRYERYYTKGLYHFNRTKLGFCSRYDKIVGNNDSCDYWESNRRRYCMRKKAASRALYEILTEISAIRQIFHENREDEIYYHGNTKDKETL